MTASRRETDEGKRPVPADRNEAPPAGPASSDATLLAAYVAAIFLSAALLFAVQPLFTKMVLPQLGGSPSVWSVALVFFQGMLLAGYLYAHFLTRFLPGRRSVALHIIVMLAATLALPLGVASGWGRPPEEGEAVWLIGLFAASIGLPFFALSANAPLLQAWFARTGHPSAHDPYFLYAASNVGSFLALLSYPFVVEPLTRVSEQTRIWTVLFYLLIAAIGLCGVLLIRSKDQVASDRAVGAGTGAAPHWRDAAIWTALAAVPSAFLIAVTAHISTDVASAPLLWVLPLALYLLSFVLVFQPRPFVSHSVWLAVQPAAMALLVGLMAFGSSIEIVLAIAINLIAFFVTAMVCHGELARRRPPARYLTAFYLWLSVGGVVGGIFASLIAPRIFNDIYEYPLLIVAAILCRPDIAVPTRGRDWAFLGFAAAALAAAIYSIRVLDLWPEPQAFNGLIGVLLIVTVMFLSRHSLRMAAIFAGAIVVIHVYFMHGSTVHTARSFFGVNRVFETGDGRFRVLMHGTTIHGAQRVRDSEGARLEGRPETITYFGPDSPMAVAFEAVKQNRAGPIRVATVGLGAGTVACFLRPEDELRFYEIDRTVVQIARDPRLFAFIDGCKPDADIVLGDARLTLSDAPDGHYDLIVMDAFTSDAVPLHLLSREAMALYLRKLAPGGLVVSHVMNRHLELASVVANIAAANGMVTRVMYSGTESDYSTYTFASTVAAMARDDADFGALLNLGTWHEQPPDPDQRVWTDDYSNVVGAVIRNMRQ